MMMKKKLKLKHCYYVENSKHLLLGCSCGCVGTRERKKKIVFVFCFCFGTMKHVFILHDFVFYLIVRGGTHAVINLINE
jgi:hypothetical protein